MTRFIASWALGFFLSFGYTTFFHYQLVSTGPLDGMRVAAVALFTLGLTAVNFYLSFWNLAGFPQKPAGWELFEEKGIPYTLRRSNLNFLFFIGASLTVFCGFAFALDFLLGNAPMTTIKGMFVNKNAAEAIQSHYYWNSDKWYLFLSLYLTSGISGGFIARQAWERREEEELPEPEHQVREEDR